MNNKVDTKYLSQGDVLKKKRRKDMWIFCMYMVVGTLGLVEACFSYTLPQCIILVVVSVITIVCGLVIKKQGTEDSVWENYFPEE